MNCPTCEQPMQHFPEEIFPSISDAGHIVWGKWEEVYLCEECECK